MKFTDKDIELAKKLKEQGYNWLATNRNRECSAYEKKPYRFKFDGEDTGLWSNKLETKWKDLPKGYFKPIAWESGAVRLDEIINDEIKPKYERLTKWSNLRTLHIMSFDNKEIPLCEVSAFDIDLLAKRLAELEDKIENGELIFREE